MLSLNKVKEEIYMLGNKINLENTSNLYPMFSNSSEVFSDGISVYIDDSKYHYITMDRGQIRSHYESANLEEIMYFIFESITFSLAKEYELDHRERGRDFRRVLFSKQLEFMRILDIPYYEKCKQEIDNILVNAPFRDDLF